jgi:hypothetical protein
VARMNRDATFSTFARNVRKCLSSSAVPRCLAPFVKPGFYDSTIGIAAPDELVDFLLREPSEYGLRPWDQLVACFTVGRMTVMSADRVRFETDQYYCDLERFDGRWLLELFYHRP